MATAADYFDRWNPDLLDLLPPDLGTVLEVGCGAGRLCQEYRRRNPGVTWYGIEADREAAALAGRRGVSIWGHDVEGEEMGAPPLDDPLADVLIFGDVLEHLRDPWRVLEQQAAWLEPGGLVLASIPNVQHYSVITRLIEGGWRYEPEGLLDRTHLRFFDYDGIRDLFRGAGLEVFEMRGRNCGFDPKGWETFKARVRGVGDAAYEKMTTRARVYQWLVRARKPVAGEPAFRPDRLHLHAVADTLDVCRQRLGEPHRAIQTIPGATISDDVLVPAPEQALFPDRHPKLPAGRDAVLVLQRWRRGGMAGIVRRVLAEKPRCLVVAEVDDHPGFLAGMERDDFAALRLTHAVQCSTEPLAEWCRRYNPEVRVVPNQVAELPPFCSKPERPPGEATLFYGAQGREDSWRPIMGALNRVLAEYPAVRVEVLDDRAFFEALEVDAKRRRFRPFLPYHEYRAAIRACDVALLPLEDSEFSRMKSDVKAIECFAEGTAVIAGRTVYGDLAPQGPLAVSIPPKLRVYETPHEFRVHLDELLWNPRERASMAKRAYDHVVAGRLLKDHYRGRVAWYRELMARKAELDAALLARCGADQAASASSYMTRGSGASEPGGP